MMFRSIAACFFGTLLSGSVLWVLLFGLVIRRAMGIGSDGMIISSIEGVIGTAVGMALPTFLYACLAGIFVFRTNREPPSPWAEYGKATLLITCLGLGAWLTAIGVDTSYCQDMGLAALMFSVAAWGPGMVGVLCVQLLRKHWGPSGVHASAQEPDAHAE